jgi:hypothetical protein
VQYHKLVYFLHTESALEKFMAIAEGKSAFLENLQEMEVESQQS